MTDSHKARKFAEDYVGITNVVFEHDPAEVMNLAKAFLALSEKCEKLERVAQVTRAYMSAVNDVTRVDFFYELGYAFTALERGETND